MKGINSCTRTIEAIEFGTKCEKVYILVLTHLVKPTIECVLNFNMFKYIFNCILMKKMCDSN